MTEETPLLGKKFTSAHSSRHMNMNIAVKRTGGAAAAMESSSAGLWNDESSGRSRLECDDGVGAIRKGWIISHTGGTNASQPHQQQDSERRGDQNRPSLARGQDSSVHSQTDAILFDSDQYQTTVSPHESLITSGEDPTASSRPAVTLKSPPPHHRETTQSQQGAATKSSDHTDNIMVHNSNPVLIRPVMYSAIGSLEEFSADSFGKRNKQYKNLRTKSFSKPSAAPANQVVHLSSLSIKHPLKKDGRRSGGDTPERNKSTGSLPQLMEQQEAAAKLEDRLDYVANDMAVDDVVKRDTKEPQAMPFAGSDRSNPQEGSNPRRASRKGRRVRIDKNVQVAKPLERFRPSCDAYTPRMEKKKIQYKPAEKRPSLQSMASPMGTLSRPNFRDALRRVSMILHQHITKIERRFHNRETSDGLFRGSMRDHFSEDRFATPLYKCAMVRVPMARAGMVYGLRKIKANHTIPTEEEIYEFGYKLFNKVQLSSECSIICLIYVERLMEVARVPLVANTWRPVFLCGLLMASKVWQDLSSWNIEFSVVYPEFSLASINQLELQFLRLVKWDLYISSTLYAKYYFALRALVGKSDFRQRYNRMVGGVGSVDAMEALNVQKRTEEVKEQVALHFLSRSM